ncbi:unnamed protein product [Rotaria sordida]|uniref:Uncharacterized protein n=1 Tax=Rotaria sordida TaxID=392033 RepID=A0A814FP34_9BILA|nr:unnamed protein product [Rotaria sordida]
MTTTRSTRRNHVHVRVGLRKSLKRRSKKVKNRIHSNKFKRITSSLIINDLLNQNSSFAHVSFVRKSTISGRKTVKNKSKTRQNFPRTDDITDQQQIYQSESQHDHIQSLNHIQRRNSKHSNQVLHNPEQLNSVKLNDYNDQHLNTLESSSHPVPEINSTIDKIVLQNPYILSSNHIHGFIPSSSYQLNRKNVDLLHSTTANLSPSLTDIAFSAIIRSKKKSLVHPNNEQRDQSLSNKKKKRYCSPSILALACILSAFLIGGIIAAIIIPLTMNKNSSTTTITTTVVSSTTITTTTVSTTTSLAPACNTSSYTTCSTVLFHNISILVPPLEWILVSCCYAAPTVNQSTIEIAVQDDSGGHWGLDNVSAIQGNGELISNGGFENNLINWTLTVYSNATSTTTVIFSSGNEFAGSAYLFGSSMNAPAYVKQTFSIIPGQSILISFWWKYYPLLGGGYGTSELIVTLT